MDQHTFFQGNSGYPPPPGTPHYPEEYERQYAHPGLPGVMYKRIPTARSLARTAPSPIDSPSFSATRSYPESYIRYSRYLNSDDPHNVPPPPSHLPSYRPPSPANNMFARSAALPTRIVGDVRIKVEEEDEYTNGIRRNILSPNFPSRSDGNSIGYGATRIKVEEEVEYLDGKRRHTTNQKLPESPISIKLEDEDEYPDGVRRYPPNPNPNPNPSSVRREQIPREELTLRKFMEQDYPGQKIPSSSYTHTRYGSTSSAIPINHPTQSSHSPQQGYPPQQGYSSQQGYPSPPGYQSRTQGRSGSTASFGGGYQYH